MDILGVSFAGTTPSTHNRIRKGTDFDTVVEALEYLQRIKIEKKTTKPAVHLAYVMLTSNFDELSRITSLARKVGAEQVVASNLTLIQKPQLFQEALFNNPQLCNGYRRSLTRIKKEAADNNIQFFYHDPVLSEDSCVCPENVCRACVINVKGEVGPCVFTNSTLSGSSGKTSGKEVVAIFKDQPIPFASVSFGNIKNTELTRIWQSAKYEKFRELFDPETRLSPGDILAGMPPSCKTCYKRLVSS